MTWGLAFGFCCFSAKLKLFSKSSTPKFTFTRLPVN